MLMFLSAGGELAMSADECHFLTLASRLPRLRSGVTERLSSTTRLVPAACDTRIQPTAVNGMHSFSLPSLYPAQYQLQYPGRVVVRTEIAPDVFITREKFATLIKTRPNKSKLRHRHPG